MPKISEPVVLNNLPDKPVGFGYKTSWLSVKSNSLEAVIGALQLRKVEAANWSTGIEFSYRNKSLDEGYVFVSPPLEGWIFVVGDLPNIDVVEGKFLYGNWLPMMLRLSQQFGETQYFGTHRVSSWNVWARFIDGFGVRVFYYCGGNGEMAVEGQQTLEEQALGYNYFDPNSPEAEQESYWDREDLCYPDEEHVMEVAGKWSINPTDLYDKEYPAGIGMIGKLNRDWQEE